MSEQNENKTLINENWMPTRARNFLQVELIRLMCGKNPSNEACEEWSSKYSEIVHRIIDNPENARIRSLILQSRYEEAANEIKTMLINGELLEGVN